MTPQELEQARKTLFDRLLLAGWAYQTARTGEFFGIRFTPHGLEQMKIIKRCLSELQFSSMRDSDAFALGELLAKSLDSNIGTTPETGSDERAN